MNKKLISVLLICFLSVTAAKSFDIMEAKTEMNILSNGSVKVTEEMDVKFKGSFSYGYRDIPIENEKIENVKVLIDGKETSMDISWEGNKKHIRYDMYANYEEKNIKIKYLLQNAVKSYNDVNDFYWKAWGSQWADEPEKFTAIVTLPEPVSNESNLKRWGHPDLPGAKISSNKQKAVFMAENVPEHQWIEVRVVFPKEILNSTAGAREINEEGLVQIIEQEKSFQTNYAISSTFWNIVWGAAYLLLVLIPVAMIALFFYLYKKHGEEPEVDYEGIYEHEPPFKYPPAYVGALFNIEKEEPKTKDFMASILHLAYKGYFKLQKVTDKGKILGFIDTEEEDNRIVFTGKRPQDLPKSLRDLYYFIQDYATKSDEYGNLGVNFNTLEEKSLEEPKEFQEFFKDWKEQVKKEVDEKNFFASDKAQDIYGKIVGISGILFVASLIPLFIIGMTIPITMMISAYFLEITITGGFLLLIFPGALPKRTEKGALHYEKWKAFKKYVEDFGNLEEYPPAHVTLWEQFLVYATSLNVAKEVLNGMENVFTQPTNNSTIYTDGNIQHYHTVGFSSSLSTFSSPGTFTASSGGAGGAGGFSGGGGFGGGGGGGGFG